MDAIEGYLDLFLTMQLEPITIEVVVDRHNMTRKLLKVTETLH
jgi:hypothetical protein